MIYQLRLLDRQGVPQAAEAYVALDDDDALEVAFGVHRAVSDHFDGYEVWQGDRRIDDHAHHQPRAMTLEEVVTKRVDNILDLEDRLSASFEAIRKSLKLLETVNVLTTWRNRR
jgi:hypothetical protein